MKKKLIDLSGLNVFKNKFLIDIQNRLSNYIEKNIYNQEQAEQNDTITSHYSEMQERFNAQQNHLNTNSTAINTITNGQSVEVGITDLPGLSQRIEDLKVSLLSVSHLKVDKNNGTASNLTIENELTVPSVIKQKNSYTMLDKVGCLPVVKINDTKSKYDGQLMAMHPFALSQSINTYVVETKAPMLNDYESVPDFYVKTDDNTVANRITPEKALQMFYDGCEEQEIQKTTAILTSSGYIYVQDLFSLFLRTYFTTYHWNLQNASNSNVTGIINPHLVMQTLGNWVTLYTVTFDTVENYSGNGNIVYDSPFNENYIRWQICAPIPISTFETFLQGKTRNKPYYTDDNPVYRITNIMGASEFESNGRPSFLDINMYSSGSGSSKVINIYLSASLDSFTFNDSEHHGVSFISNSIDHL